MNNEGKGSESSWLDRLLTDLQIISPLRAVAVFLLIGDGFFCLMTPTMATSFEKGKIKGRHYGYKSQTGYDVNPEG